MPTGVPYMLNPSSFEMVAKMSNFGSKKAPRKKARRKKTGGQKGAPLTPARLRAARRRPPAPR